MGAESASKSCDVAEEELPADLAVLVAAARASVMLRTDKDAFILSVCSAIATLPSGRCRAPANVGNCGALTDRIDHDLNGDR